MLLLLPLRIEENSVHTFLIKWQQIFTWAGDDRRAKCGARSRPKKRLALERPEPGEGTGRGRVRVAGHGWGAPSAWWGATVAGGEVGDGVSEHPPPPQRRNSSVCLCRTQRVSNGDGRAGKDVYRVRYTALRSIA